MWLYRGHLTTLRVQMKIIPLSLPPLPPRTSPLAIVLNSMNRTAVHRPNPKYMSFQTPPYYFPPLIKICWFCFLNIFFRVPSVHCGRWDALPNSPAWVHLSFRCALWSSPLHACLCCLGLPEGLGLQYRISFCGGATFSLCTEPSGSTGDVRSGNLGMNLVAKHPSFPIPWRDSFELCSPQFPWDPKWISAPGARSSSPPYDTPLADIPLSLPHFSQPPAPPGITSHINFLHLSPCFSAFF